jgi:hypothetical protein
MPFASEDALTGLGMEPHLADLIGAQPNTQAGHGTTQNGATILLGQSNELTTTGGNTTFVFPTSPFATESWDINVPIHCFCSSATTAVVYVPSGHKLNGTLNGSLSIAQNKAALFWQYSSKNWVSILSNV